MNAVRLAEKSASLQRIKLNMFFASLHHHHAIPWSEMARAKLHSTSSKVQRNLSVICKRGLSGLIMNYTCVFNGDGGF